MTRVQELLRLIHELGVLRTNIQGQDARQTLTEAIDALRQLLFGPAVDKNSTV
jgi:hypothetical protein